LVCGHVFGIDTVSFGMRRMTTCNSCYKRLPADCDWNGFLFGKQATKQWEI